MASLERFLIQLDNAPWSVLSRVVLGLVIPPALRAISGGRDSVWMSLGLFLGVLIALRVIPALVRHALPFSAGAKAIWSERRQTAKRYDSYQWQKLFWIGLGMLPYAVIGDGLSRSEQLVLLLCLVGGGAGLWIWRKVDPSASAT